MNTVTFSPSGGCTAAIVALLAAARQTVDVLAYEFTEAAIGAAVADAHRRGVAVRVVLDKDAAAARSSLRDYLVAHGVAVWTDGAHAIMHDKVMVIDGAAVVTGSFNFTANAELHNAENCVVLRDKNLTAAYAANFLVHLGHSVRA